MTIEDLSKQSSESVLNPNIAQLRGTTFHQIMIKVLRQTIGDKGLIGDNFLSCLM